ncbi:hypothetical protein ECTPHS_13868 [Ectothiorhodospira sp. PHS-1]|uniref:hypothetical protein n=1 Tax=Ectothiorhodospira sp. PHS-1 TaxID=519989 RepID=UPI00024A80B7|nr:hypothetical protein [Ectothiorhodospira sp. PHS-1]EHQ53750.1 hypothetical protein ECTPHS_13868 [Ectothiorhodospira sp. PHS-1]
MTLKNACISRISGIILVLALASVLSSPAGAAVPVDREITGRLDAWDSQQQYVILNGRRYTTMEHVLIHGLDGSREGNNLRGRQVTLQIVGDQVYRIILADDQ